MCVCTSVLSCNNAVCRRIDISYSKNFGGKKVWQKPTIAKLTEKNFGERGFTWNFLATTNCTAQMQHRYMRVIINSPIKGRGSRFDCESIPRIEG